VDLGLLQDNCCTIAALTAYLNRENIENCETSGMKEILNKPAKASEIEELIMQYCGRFVKRKH